MSAASVKIRNLTRSELDMAVQWAADEGWNPGLHDADAFWAQDSQGFFGIEQDGRIVNTVSAVRYGDSYAFCGFYITRPGLRNQGLGARMVPFVFERLGKRIIGGDGVLAMQDYYKSLGFELAFRSVRCQGDGGTDPSNQSVELATLPFDHVLAYDSLCFPEPRPEFLRKWIAMPGSHALGILTNGKLGGYGVIRPCRLGWKIGPLFADNPEIAEALYLDLRAKADSGPVFLDVPLNNSAAEAMADRYGMQRVFETGRMYKNGLPPWRDELVFGITTFELG